MVMRCRPRSASARAVPRMREVVGLGGPGGEDDLVRRAHRSARPPARAPARRARAPAAEAMRRSRVAEHAVARQALAHHRRHARDRPAWSRRSPDRPARPRSPALMSWPARRRALHRGEDAAQDVDLVRSSSARCSKRRMRVIRCVPLWVRSRKSISSQHLRQVLRTAAPSPAGVASGAARWRCRAVRAGALLQPRAQDLVGDQLHRHREVERGVGADWPGCASAHARAAAPRW